ncbi:hypothetical protein B0H19DRAFT_1197292, partial [Mycena capillaripes]
VRVRPSPRQRALSLDWGRIRGRSRHRTQRSLDFAGSSRSSSKRCATTSHTSWAKCKRGLSTGVSTVLRNHRVGVRGEV